ncbi:C-type lectin domain family 17, member A-like isoform X2 [Anabas testudineus]|nr:C-type lectin domain family 17, member A-like isoform X2 [Anabas testudineus]
MLLLLLLTFITASAADNERDQILQMCTAKNVLQYCSSLGWYRLDGNRCMRSTRTLAPFDTAEMFCTREGGHLVSINSQADYTKVLCLLVKDLAYRNLYWIGARKRQGKYYWINGGGPLTFTQWAPDKPKGSQDDCVEMNFGAWGLWNNQACSENRLFVCEKRG